MLKFEEKEYDLNFLCTFTFDFQMLKELLINLAKSNQEMAKKIKIPYHNSKHSLLLLLLP